VAATMTVIPRATKAVAANKLLAFIIPDSHHSTNLKENDNKELNKQSIYIYG
jgi:hypothetical protein